MSKKNTTLQGIRLSTMKHQLKALASQVDAIKKLDCEHHEGLDLGVDPELANIQHFSRRLASRAETIVIKSRENRLEGVRVLLDKMREDVTYLLEHAEAFRTHANERAGAHLREILHVDPAEVDRCEVNGTAFTHAGVSCFKAETSQYHTIEMQVRALVHLALEIAYFAGDEVGLSKEEVAGKLAVQPVAKV